MLYFLSVLYANTLFGVNQFAGVSAAIRFCAQQSRSATAFEEAIVVRPELSGEKTALNEHKDGGGEGRGDCLFFNQL